MSEEYVIILSFRHCLTCHSAEAKVCTLCLPVDSIFSDTIFVALLFSTYFFFFPCLSQYSAIRALILIYEKDASKRVYFVSVFFFFVHLHISTYMVAFHSEMLCAFAKPIIVY